LKGTGELGKSLQRSKTILYYTGNAKDPVFEQKIRDYLLKTCNNIPIVSVTQKPVDLGTNICVGNVGHSYLNVYRQIEIGINVIKTEYIIFAEDDFLYTPEYFSFDPPGGNFYRYDNVWFVMHVGAYRQAYPIGGAQIMKRDFALEQLKIYLEGQPKWMNRYYKVRKPDWNGAEYELFTGRPIINFKPSNNLSMSGSTTGKQARVIDPYGAVTRLRREYGVG
jgi:hypothetical protein